MRTHIYATTLVYIGEGYLKLCQRRWTTLGLLSAIYHFNLSIQTLRKSTKTYDRDHQRNSRTCRMGFAGIVDLPHEPLGPLPHVDHRFGVSSTYPQYNHISTSAFAHLLVRQNLICCSRRFELLCIEFTAKYPPRAICTNLSSASAALFLSGWYFLLSFLYALRMSFSVADLCTIVNQEVNLVDL